MEVAEWMHVNWIYPNFKTLVDKLIDAYTKAKVDIHYMNQDSIWLYDEKLGTSKLSVVTSGNRDRNISPIVVSQTTDRRDIPVPLLSFQILLPHSSRKS